MSGVATHTHMQTHTQAMPTAHTEGGASHYKIHPLTELLVPSLSSQYHHSSWGQRSNPNPGETKHWWKRIKNLWANNQTQRVLIYLCYCVSILSVSLHCPFTFLTEGQEVRNKHPAHAHTTWPQWLTDSQSQSSIFENKEPEPRPYQLWFPRSPLFNRKLHHIPAHGHCRELWVFWNLALRLSITHLCVKKRLTTLELISEGIMATWLLPASALMRERSKRRAELFSLSQSSSQRLLTVSMLLYCCCSSMWSNSEATVVIITVSAWCRDTSTWTSSGPDLWNKQEVNQTLSRFQMKVAENCVFFCRKCSSSWLHHLYLTLLSTSILFVCWQPLVFKDDIIVCMSKKKITT